MTRVKKKKHRSARARGGATQPGSEAGSCLRLTDFVYRSTLGLRVKKKKKTQRGGYAAAAWRNTPHNYRGTSLIRPPPPQDPTVALCTPPVGPYSSPMPRDLW